MLVVDDEPAFCELMTLELSERGFRVETAASVDQAKQALDERWLSFDAVVTDLNLGQGNGLDVVRHVNQAGWPLPVVVLTGFGSIQSAVLAIREGAYDFLTKPFEPDALVLTVERAAELARLRRELARLKQSQAPKESFGIIGGSRVMRALVDLIRRVGPSEATVLITGESGTGKELVARALHQASPRSHGPLVSLNCGAVPATLLESELFGHVKGSFTDAKVDRSGVVREADGGTLFLDEVGELPPALQPKLLRLLQERTVRPVGAPREVPVNVRIVAATNVDLHAAVESGRFREDLYYRLDVVNLDVPPLRARGTDVLLLAQHFLQRSAERNHQSPKRLSDDAAALLVGHQWPGNVRELENAIERATTLGTGELLTPQDLPERLHQRTLMPVPDETDTSTLLPLAEVERRYVLKVLEQLKGNKRRAAQVLGLDRSTLYRRLKEFGVRDAASSEGEG